MRKRIRIALTLTLAAVVACGADEAAPPAGVPAVDPPPAAGGAAPARFVGPYLAGDCDPIAPEQCGFPFPSDVYTVADDGAPTGRRVRFGAATLPTRRGPDGQPVHVDPRAWNDSDGFSPVQGMLTFFPDASLEGLPRAAEASLERDCPTVILDAVTGARVPHFAELDESDPSVPPRERALILRPFVRLTDGHRYVVALRRLKDVHGAAVEPSPAFRALRDGTPTTDPSVESRRALYADVFARLRAAGVGASDLVLAWDFTTASTRNNTAAMLAIRDRAFAAQPDGPPYAVTEVTEAPFPGIRRRIRGELRAPLFLEDERPGAGLIVGEDGAPLARGTMRVPFVLLVPDRAADGPLPLLQNGHGTLRNREQGTDTYLAEMARTYGYVVFSVDWAGMASDDATFLFDVTLGDIGRMRLVTERLHQGMLNALLAMRVARRQLPEDALLQVNGHSAIDPSKVYFRGDSQGGILGTTYMALTTDVPRGLLGVPGMSYNLMLTRSSEFEPFFGLLKLTYTHPRDLQLAMALVGMHWDRIEGAGYAEHVTHDPLPGTPSHDVLLHVAIGDRKVPPLAAHLLARSLRARSVVNAPRPVWGIEQADGPITGTALAEFDFGLTDAPNNLPPPSDPALDPHPKLREAAVAQAQQDAFFRRGVVEPACPGVCRLK